MYYLAVLYYSGLPKRARGSTIASGLFIG